jgi:transcriptional regulator GlxA family with amidase domain
LPQTRTISGTDEPRRIAMLIYPGVAPLDVAGPLEVFGVANFLQKRKLYDVITVAPTADPVPTPLGFAFLPNCGMEDLEFPVDTLLVSGGGSPDAGTDPRIGAWLRASIPRARRYGAVCTGAFALAAAGLTKGKRVVTHWAFADELASRNPDTKVEIEPIFIRDGCLYTSGGISAGIDLALALLEDDHGRAFALEVARYLVLFLKRSGGQAQFSTQLQAQFSAIPGIQRAQHWILDRLSGDLRVAVLAKKAGMSERSFVRSFRAETGKSPGEYIAAARLQAARRLLEDTRLEPKRVAAQSGIGSAASMRRVFLRELGVSPNQYREKFQREFKSA